MLSVSFTKTIKEALKNYYNIDCYKITDLKSPGGIKIYHLYCVHNEYKFVAYLHLNSYYEEVTSPNVSRGFEVFLDSPSTNHYPQKILAKYLYSSKFKISFAEINSLFNKSSCKFDFSNDYDGRFSLLFGSYKFKNNKAIVSDIVVELTAKNKISFIFLRNNLYHFAEYVGFALFQENKLYLRTPSINIIQEIDILNFDQADLTLNILKMLLISMKKRMSVFDDISNEYIMVCDIKALEQICTLLEMVNI